MEDFLKTYGVVFGAGAALLIFIITSLRSSFKELRDKDSELKDLIHNLDTKLEKLDERFRGLQERDELQELTLSKLPELMPEIHTALVQIAKGKNK